MLRTFVTLATAATIVAGLGHAHANPVAQHPFALKMSGGQFVDLCTDPPPQHGAPVVAMCEMYIAGIADALKADGRICSPPWLSPRQLFGISAAWIETRRSEIMPVSVMVRNGLVAAFPCAASVRHTVRSNAGNDLSEKVTRFLEAAGPLIKLFTMLAK